MILIVFDLFIIQTITYISSRLLTITLNSAIQCTAPKCSYFFKFIGFALWLQSHQMINIFFKFRLKKIETIVTTKMKLTILF